MRSISLLAVIMLVLIAVPCLSQGFGSTCNPTGTWIGGSDPQAPTYQMTLVPTAAGRYAMIVQYIPDPGFYSTAFTGELIKNGAQTYKAYLIATYTQAELDAAYSQGVMLDCNTLQFKYTWLGVYLPMTSDKIPFVTQPEIEVIRDFLGGSPIVETYHRVSADSCPVCEMGGLGNPVSSISGTATQKLNHRWLRKK